MTAATSWKRRAALVVVACSLTIGRVGQSQRAKQAGRPVATSRGEVRAELAATLLNANRFDEAAAEYRRLLATDGGNRGYRLGLARALAWGDHPREAERELVRARDRSNADVVEPLLRSVRVAFEPTAAEATAWQREAPGYLPYRVVLARALAREDPRRAIAQFDTLRLAALAGATGVPAEPVLIREEADAYLAMGARPSAIMLLGAGVNKSPADTGLRHALAGALLDAGMLAAARAEYDTLIIAAPAADAFVGRANAALAMHDTASAQLDLARSLTAHPTYEAYYQLGSIARDHEDYVNARLFYDGAGHTARDAAGRQEVAAAMGGLSREARPVVAFAPSVGSDAGWSVTTQSAADNSGVSYVAMDASRVAQLAGGFMSDFGFGVRRIAQTGTIGPAAATGTTASFGLSRQVVFGRAAFGAAAHGGVVAHPGVATFGRGSVSAAGWFDAWSVGADLSREPAYETLFTPAVLLLGGEGSALIAKTATFSTGGPVGPLDAAASWTRSWLSDGNFGESFDAYARAPLTSVSRYLFAVYQGNISSYAEPTTLYWDPVRYTSNAVGPELATRHAHGLSVSARVLAGYAIAEMRDTLTERGPVMRQSALQLSSGGGASYRAAWWEGAADVGYGRTRAGAYQRFSATVTFRVLR